MTLKQSRRRQLMPLAKAQKTQTNGRVREGSFYSKSDAFDSSVAKLLKDSFILEIHSVTRSRLEAGESTSEGALLKAERVARISASDYLGLGV